MNDARRTMKDDARDISALALIFEQAASVEIHGQRPSDAGHRVSRRELEWIIEGLKRLARRRDLATAVDERAEANRGQPGDCAGTGST